MGGGVAVTHTRVEVTGTAGLLQCIRSPFTSFFIAPLFQKVGNARVFSSGSFIRLHRVSVSVVVLEGGGRRRVAGSGPLVPHRAVEHVGVGAVPQHGADAGVSAGGSALWRLNVLPGTRSTGLTATSGFTPSQVFEIAVQRYLISLATSFS